ncbi:PREDICTED: uncharacterized protein LOC104607192 isoform X3 [Nelumbo nucifera]|uniref:Uncharacterized protein LOC104607192 isoform X3 n=1 Tax=Nelumbo nucifera TaxID=4432 RepID=A0A1U8Q833_NELNU|nr:PREDICTED: uncharacterized protein LOC104607192 isoform X3 [Nelumbo nucifera]
MELQQQKKLRDDPTSSYWSFGSNYNVGSQTRKVSIGITVDASAKRKPANRKEDAAALQNTGKVASSGGKCSEDKNKDPGVVAVLKGKQANIPEQENSPWVSTRHLHEETPATVTDNLYANQTSVIQPSSVMQKEVEGAKEKITTKTVQFFPNQSNAFQSTNGVTYGRAKGTTEWVEDFAFVTAQEIHVLNGEGEEKSNKTANRSSDILRMKLSEILGAFALSDDHHSNSQTLVAGTKILKPVEDLKQNNNKENLDTTEKNLSPVGHLDPKACKIVKPKQSLNTPGVNLKPVRHLNQKNNAVLKPKQNSDTIEPDSESPDQTIKRPMTRSLSKKKAPSRAQLNLQNKILYAGNLPPSPSHSKKHQENSIFNFDEADKENGNSVGWSGSLHGTTTASDSSYMPNNKNIRKENSKVKQQRSHFSKKDIPNKIQQPTTRRKIPVSVERTESRNNGMGDFCGFPQNDREGMQPKSRTAEEDFHHFLVREERDQSERTESHENRTENFHVHPPQSSRDYVQHKSKISGADFHHFSLRKGSEQQSYFKSSPLLKSAIPLEDFGNPSLEKNDQQNDFQSPRCRMGTPNQTCSSSPLLPSTTPTEWGVLRPATADRNFMGDDKEHNKSPTGELSPTMEEHDAKNRQSQLSSEEQYSESIDKALLKNKGYRERETRSTKSKVSKTPEFLPNPTKRLRTQGSFRISKISPTSASLKGFEKRILGQGFSDENHGDGLAGAVTLFALALERFKTKMKLQTSKKSSEILASVSEEIWVQLQNVESQIKSDLGKLTNAGNSKRKHLESRCQAQKEGLKLIYEKFKEEVNQHLQVSKRELEELEEYQTELKGSVERQNGEGKDAPT